MFKMFDTWSARRRAVAELSRLSDRALADLGIARTDIVAIVSAAAGAQTPVDVAAGHRGVPAWTTQAAPVAA